MEFVQYHIVPSGNPTFPLKERGLSDHYPRNALVEEQKGISGQTREVIR